MINKKNNFFVEGNISTMPLQYHKMNYKEIEEIWELRKQIVVTCRKYQTSSYLVVAPKSPFSNIIL
jgi:hypothetical protein